MTPLLALLILAGTDPDCGGTVVSGTGPTVSLYDRSGTRVAELKVKDNSLAEPLPIVRCSPTMVLVRYKGQELRADRYQIVTRGVDRPPPCTGSGGSAESRSSARTMNGIEKLSCHPPKQPPAPATPAAKGGKKKK